MITIEQAEEIQQALAAQLIAEKSSRAVVNRFILENLRDGFCAGKPRLVLIGREPAWSVPVLLASPAWGMGEVGEVLVHAVEGTIVGYTTPTEIYRHAQEFLA